MHKMDKKELELEDAMNTAYDAIVKASRLAEGIDKVELEELGYRILELSSSIGGK